MYSFSGGSGVNNRFAAHYKKEHDKLDESLAITEEIKSQGKGIMGQLQNQREILIKSRNRTVDMLKAIGMSESIIKLIEKRTKGDWLIFLGLAVGTLVLMYVLIYYVKPLL